MKKIRIGNDLTLRVTVTRLGSEESLEDKQLRLLVRSALETRQLSFTREGSVLTAFWAGSEQAKTGTYTVTLIADYGESSRNTVDTCGAFALVARSGSEDGDALTGAQTIDLDIDVSVPANGLSAYELALRGGYEGTEEEWLDSLKAAPDGKIEELEEQVKAGTQAAEAAQSAANQAKSAANDAYNKASDNETAISEEQTARKTADEELTTKVNAATQAVSTLSSEKTFTAADGTECTATVYLGGLSTTSAQSRRTTPRLTPPPPTWRATPRAPSSCGATPARRPRAARRGASSTPPRAGTRAPCSSWRGATHG